MSEHKGLKRGQAKKKARLYMVLAGLCFAGIAVALVTTALEDNVAFFFGPSEIQAGKVEPGQNFRLGGLVSEGSVRLMEDGVTNVFSINDGKAEVEVVFKGLLPDLFREGQGIVAQGALSPQRQFVAYEVLAKHDENYMPTEVVEAMKRAGTWKHGDVPGIEVEESQSGY